MDFWSAVAVFEAAVGAKKLVAKWLLRRQAPHWPLTGAQIFHGDPDPDLHEIYYNYQVNGSYYSGHFWRRRFKNTNPSQLAGRPVLIRYKPDQPEISFLLDSDQVGSMN